MVFFNASTDDSEFSQLEFMYDIEYSGEIPIRDIRFHHELPSGFVYKEGSARIDSVQTEPVFHEGEKDIWEVGNWNSEQHTKLDIAMKPDDYDKVQNTGTVLAHLEMIDIDGNVVVTDSLETKISTLIETLSFNMVLEGTQFASGSADLQPSATSSLDKLGQFLSWQPDIEVVIEGFTDNRGSLEFNMLLSEWRAISVKNYLLENFEVNSDNIHIHGMGPHYPVGDNETWSGRASNRRVEVLVNAEVGEVALLKLDVLKESLKQSFEIPLDPMKMMRPDSALSIPTNQSSTLSLNMSYPAYPGADSMVVALALPEDLEYVETAGKLLTWSQKLDKDATGTSSQVRVYAGEGVVGVKELRLNVQLFKDNMPLSSVIERTMKVNIEDPERSNE
jgi:outer membrane protein OmpA-like peptidoglycan-associated protein